MRCVDLNFSYSDPYGETVQNFSNTNEYFRSTEYILKQIIKINFPESFLFVLRKADGQLLTEIGFKCPQIFINRYLNTEMNMKIAV
jgi:hypothetical protein